MRHFYFFDLFFFYRLKACDRQERQGMDVLSENSEQKEESGTGENETPVDPELNSEQKEDSGAGEGLDGKIPSIQSN